MFHFGEDCLVDIFFACRKQNVWHETADYSANQFNFEMGSILGQPELPSDTFKILDRRNRQIWSTPIDETAWNNFAVTIDYVKK